MEIEHKSPHTCDPQATTNQYNTITIRSIICNEAGYNLVYKVEKTTQLISIVKVTGQNEIYNLLKDYY